MLPVVFASLVIWAALFFGLKFCLIRLNPPRWVRRTINLSVAMIAVSWVVGAVFYVCLERLLTENSMIWTLS
jgi:hypothetical protein